MEKKARILIVEDEVVIASDIQTCLEEMGFDVVGIAISATGALSFLETAKIDLVLLDISIKGGMNGIELANTINEKYHLPFVYLTSHSDPKTVQQAVKTKPSGYIVKPFESPDIYTSVLLALNTEQEATPVNSEKVESSNDFLFVKDGYDFIKIKFDDLLWVKAAGNYIELHCSENKKYLIRSTIIEMIEKLPFDQFLRIHKTYLVNKNKIRSFNSRSVIIEKEELPIGRAYKENLMNLLV